MELKTITLKGREIMGKVLPANNGEAKQYSKGPNSGKDYHTLVYEGKVFIVNPEVFTGREDGKLAELTLTQVERTITKTSKDAAGVETSTEVIEPTWSYGGHLSYVALKNIVQNEGEIVMLENSFKVVATKMVPSA